MGIQNRDFMDIGEERKIFLKIRPKRGANTPTKIHIGEECFFDKT